MPSFSNSGMNNWDEAKLLAHFQEHSNKVMEVLYRRYETLCYGLCLKMLKEREAAKDAVAEIFLRLRYDLEVHEVKDFRPWFYVYSRNHCLGLLRKLKYKEEHIIQWAAMQEIVESSASIAPERIGELEGALQKLKSEQRLCIMGFYYQKQSYEQIADNLKINVNKVKSHLQNGKRNLKIFLNGENSQV